MKYIGVDVGKKRCQACIMNEEGEILDEFPFTNNGEGIQRFLEQIDGEGCKAVLESTGNLWLRIYEALESHGAEVKLANPYKTKAIASARIKTDNHNEPYISISSPSVSVSILYPLTSLSQEAGIQPFGD